MRRKSKSILIIFISRLISIFLTHTQCQLTSSFFQGRKMVAPRPRLLLCLLVSVSVFMLSTSFRTTFGRSFVHPVNKVRRSAPSMAQRSVSSSSGGTATNFSSTRIRNMNPAEIQKLLMEVVQIVQTTGVQTSVFRTLQASQAVAQIGRNFLQDPTAFNDIETGQISAPKLMKSLFEKLGATYIKLGQFIASSPTLFPPEYVREFQSCLDQTPTVPYSAIRKIIQDYVNTSF